MKYIYSTLKINILFFYLFYTKIISITSANKNAIKKRSDRCTLTRKPSQDPFPSLSKCYKYNNEACCMSVHDDFIDSTINDILSSSCIRKYTEFENLMCFGCHPLESSYIEINGTQKIIRICKSFALNLWNGAESENKDYETLNKPTAIFDNCGFKVVYEGLDTLTDEHYIIPSEKFQNISHFFKFIKIPFYEDYEIVIQNVTDDYCYNISFYMNNNKIKNYLLAFLILLIFSFIL